MFGLLKKKLANFTDKLKQKVETKEPAAEAMAVAGKEEIEKQAQQKEVLVEEPEHAEEKGEEEKNVEMEKEPRIEKRVEEHKEIAEPKEEEIAKAVEAPHVLETLEKPAAEKEVALKKTVMEKGGIEEKMKKYAGEEPEGFEEDKVEEKEVEFSEEKIEIPEKFGEKRELRTKIGLGGKVKRFLGREITISEKDLAELSEELELSLLEADVEQDAAEEIVKQINSRLSGKKIGRGKGIDSEIRFEIKNILLEMMRTDSVDVLGLAKERKPLKILFLGPNGAGKTTSIAKLTKFFQNNGLTVVWAAGDTFRAASIEQLEKHAHKLGVRVIKHGYGADPAAVAFDAVKAAEAKKIDVVLIDSAGRQETNKNLMEELKKIVRVIKPDLKLYVGESFTGQALLQQASEYNEKIGVDGFVLTKIDCDVKGGTTISLLYKLKKPVLFVGTGQKYADLEKFNPEFVLNKIL
ncbi:MAG: signal recognition particle-docking protein FtsY [Candidatus Diapherotrites archaeon]|nr:signal recognition particle-docking protein FtsY [Candidatus Diapherotrites archaeon]